MFVAIVMWVTGLLTLVPYGTFYLFVHARPDQYALLITLVLFWIFGFWGVAGPLLIALRVHALMRTLEEAHAKGRLRDALRGQEIREVAVEMIARENRIPRFLAGRMVQAFAKRLSADRRDAAGPTTAR